MTSLRTIPLPAPHRASARRRPVRPAARRPYPVFIAYSDVPAARHAMTRIAKLIDDDERQLLPMLWRFDQLGRPRWREMALREAGRAATIVLAMSARETLTVATDAWLTDLTRQQHGAAISALLLVGDESWTISLQQTAARPIPLAQEFARSNAGRPPGRQVLSAA